KWLQCLSNNMSGAGLATTKLRLMPFSKATLELMHCRQKAIKKSQVRIMLKKLIANLKHNFQIFAIGSAFSAMGLLLWTDHRYFVWPPQYAGLMNDDGLDAIAVAVGVGLMYYALKDEKNNTVAGILLSITAGFTGLIAC